MSTISVRFAAGSGGGFVAAAGFAAVDDELVGWEGEACRRFADAVDPSLNLYWAENFRCVLYHGSVV